ncbi:Mu transposase C-terminal domain-containing protein [Aerolutibacter ruishenii]|uniref:Putative transposase n=1 Tax=Aerolutibacter ruishenii TaxID=686800 RepID=A0A562LDK3_9GAMM|nr:Mu transposase C-terminal domain-containing protein [Lysobacter ruishenii]TWI05723.1 putative transposase [Lysobacter ruishenii]
MVRNPTEFLVTFLPSEMRRLTRTGVQIHNLQYWGDALAQWIGQHQDVRVHYDPRDITVVYVRSPAGVIVTARVTTPEIKSISLAEWGARRNYERATSSDPAFMAQRDASQKRGDQLVSQAKASRRVRGRKATEAAGDRWRPEASPVTESATPPPAEAAPMLAAVVSQIYDVEGIDYDY